MEVISVRGSHHHDICVSPLFYEFCEVCETNISFVFVYGIGSSYYYHGVTFP